jgi:hypothetical protein
VVVPGRDLVLLHVGEPEQRAVERVTHTIEYGAREYVIDESV